VPKTDPVDDLFGAPAKPAAPAPVAPVVPAPEAPKAPAPSDDPFAPLTPAPAAPAAPAPAPAKPVDDDPFKVSAEGQLPSRLWSDNTGTFEVEGRLIAIMPDHIRLLKSNGRTTTVPMRRLSEADAKYVEEAASRHGTGLIGQVASR